MTIRDNMKMSTFTVQLEGSLRSYFLYQMDTVLDLLIFFCNCNTPYNNASAVGGQPVMITKWVQWNG